MPPKKKFYEREKPSARMIAADRHKGPGPSDAGQRVINEVRHMGGTAAKSAGQAAHDAKHAAGRAARKAGKVIDSINPFD